MPFYDSLPVEARRLARAEAHARLVMHVSRLLVSQASADYSVLGEVFAAIAETYGYEIFLHYHVNDDEPAVLHLAADGGLTPEQRAQLASIAVGQYICGRVAARGARIVAGIDDEPIDVAFPGVRSYAGFPLIAQGRLLGTATFASRSRDHAVEGEIESIQTMCDLAAVQLARGRAERRLRESQERLQVALDAADLGVWDYDLATNSVPTRSLRHDLLFGYETLQAEWTQQTAERHMLAEDVPVFRDALAQARTTGAIDVEVRVRWPDGSIHWIATLGRTFYDERGRPFRTSGVVADVTERREADAFARRSAALDAFRVALTDALRPLDDPAAIQAEASRVLGERIGATRVTYFEVSDGHYCVERDFTRDAPSIVGRYPVSSFGDALLARYQAGQTAVSGDVRADTSVPPDQQAAYAAIQIGAYIGVPLVKHGTFVAGMAVHHATPRAWTADEIRLAEETADRTWAAVERARSEAELRVAHDTFRHLVEHSPFGVYTVDADFKVTHVSAGAQKVFENVRPLIGRDLGEVFRILWPEPFAIEAIGRFRHTLATGTPYHSPGSVLHRQDIGHVETYDWQIERVVLPDGRPGVVCHFYDLSERQRYEAALREADRQKDEFIAVLAHELRNPLAPIRTAVGLLHARATGDTMLRRASEVIDRQVGQMARLLDDLLDVARLSRGKITLQRQPVPLADVIDSAIETARPAIDDRQHVLACAPIPSGFIVDADETRLAQVFGNLLNNAAKYTPPGGRIDITTEQDGDRLLVAVRDTGVGIEPAMRDRVFDLFTQAASTRERSTAGGLGIGLALARRLVEMHGGTIGVSSDGIDQGTAFIVSLPLSRAAETARRTEVPGYATADSSVAAVVRKRVLVADDNIDAADTLAMLLEDLGCEVKCVYGGDEAVRVATTFRPDLVLIDLGMPKVGGHAVCERLRAEPWGEAVTIVAVTGWGHEEDRRRTEAAGFDHHLVKPVEPHVIASLVRDL